MSLKDKRIKEKHRKLMKKIKRTMKNNGIIDSIDVQAFSDKLMERLENGAVIED